MLLEYDCKPDQIGTALALWYFPRVEVLTREIYNELITKKREVITALDKELEPYAELIAIPFCHVRAAGKTEHERR